MSWDESRQSYECPCGKSTYTVVSLSDDWGRVEARWEMNCLECQRSYCLYREYIVRHPGDEIEILLWVPKPAYEHVDDLKERLGEAKARITEIARSRYMARWLELFAGAKTKKQIWLQLTDEGKDYPSLTTFYNHIKGTTIEEYLRDWITYHKLTSVLRKLEVTDDEIERELKKISEMEEELKKATSELKRLGHR